LVNRSEERSVASRPLSEFVVPGQEFIADRFDAAGDGLVMGETEPDPESRRDIKCVVAVLGLDKDVRI
jgi:hypothetical protein